jgi:hypothetical protein
MHEVTPLPFGRVFEIAPLLAGQPAFPVSADLATAGLSVGAPACRGESGASLWLDWLGRTLPWPTGRRLAETDWSR